MNLHFIVETRQLEVDCCIDHVLMKFIKNTLACNKIEFSACAKVSRTNEAWLRMIIEFVNYDYL